LVIEIVRKLGLQEDTEGNLDSVFWNARVDEAMKEMTVRKNDTTFTADKMTMILICCLDEYVFTYL